MGTDRLLKLVLGALLALTLLAPAWADDINYVESDEGNPELPATATPSSSDLELPLLPVEEPTAEETAPPAEEEIVPKPAPAEEQPIPEQPAEETTAPTEESAAESVEIEAPASAEAAMPMPEEETGAPVESEASVSVEEEPATTAESSFNADGQAKLKAAGSLLYSGDTDAAVTAYEELVNAPDLDPQTYAGAVAGYASALRAAGRRDEAEHWYQEALTYNPDSNDLRLAYAYTLAENNKLDRALYQLDILDKAMPGNSAIALARARAYAWNGDYENAIQYYNNVTDSNLLDDATLGRAYVLYWQGDTEAARAMLSTVGREDADTRKLRAMLGPEHQQYYAGNDEPSDGSFAVTHRNATINDDNTLTGTTATLTFPLGPEGSTIFISHEDFDLDNDANPPTSPAAASGTNTRVGFTAKLDDRTHWSGYAGKVSIDNSTPQTIDHTDLGVRLAGHFDDDWSYHASYEDNLLYDTPMLAAIDDGRTSMEFGTGFKVFDDDTTLNLLYATSEYGAAKLSGYEIDLRKSSLYDCDGTLAYGIRYRTQQNTGDAVPGYFAPDDYQLGEIYLDWIDSSEDDWHLDAGVGIGMQSIDSSDWESTLRAAIGVRYDVSDNFLLRAGVSSSNLPGVANDGSGDFSRTEWYVNGEWVF